MNASDAEKAEQLAFIIPGEIKRAVESLRQVQEWSEQLSKLTGKIADELERR